MILDPHKHKVDQVCWLEALKLSTVGRVSKNIYELGHKQDLKDLKLWPLLVVSRAFTI